MQQIEEEVTEQVVKRRAEWSAGVEGLRTVWVAGGREWTDGLCDLDAVEQRVAEVIELLRELMV
ncbi:hypothetical protein ACFYW8_23075 [Streptomyces sp. NPDC002742]|uniref:hypothetical protein n=1 Tax=Streptomyces sp. NPDC002742 TaxID=3364663 RepID=UPI0036C8E3CD